MANRAPWRTMPDDPSTAWGWIVRDLRRWPRLVVRKALFGLVLLAVYALVVGSATAALALVAAAFCLALAAPPSLPSPKGDDPAPGPSYTGGLEIWRDGALIGDDRVTVTFVDGWLHVEGLRTGFALSPNDLATPLPPGERFSHRLRLRDGSDIRFWVGSAPANRGEPPFEARLMNWRDGFVPMGESVLPPGEPHPSAYARARLDLLVSTLGFLGGCVAAWTFGFLWGVLVFLVVPGPAVGEAIRVYGRLRRWAARP